MERLEVGTHELMSLLQKLVRLSQRDTLWVLHRVLQDLIELFERAVRLDVKRSEKLLRFVPQLRQGDQLDRIAQARATAVDLVS